MKLTAILHNLIEDGNLVPSALMRVDIKPEFQEAFRAAIGTTYEQERADVRAKLQQSSVLVRAWHAFRTFGGNDEDYDREHQLEGWGFSRLRYLVDQESGAYSRGPIFFYTIDGDKKSQGFMYNLVFSGKRVGEEGVVAMTYEPSRVWLKRGTEALVETVVDIDGQKGRVLYLPENEGIVLATRRRTTYGWSAAEKFTGFAKWYPELTETPQPFSRPEGGRQNWDSKKYPSFLDPTRSFGNHRYYDVLT